MHRWSGICKRFESKNVNLHRHLWVLQMQLRRRLLQIFLANAVASTLALNFSWFVIIWGSREFTFQLVVAVARERNGKRKGKGEEKRKLHNLQRSTSLCYLPLLLFANMSQVTLQGSTCLGYLHLLKFHRLICKEGKGKLTCTCSASKEPFKLHSVSFGHMSKHRTAHFFLPFRIGLYCLICLCLFECAAACKTNHRVITNRLASLWHKWMKRKFAHHN